MEDLWWPHNYISIDFLSLSTFIVIVGAVSVIMSVIGCICLRIQRPRCFHLVGQPNRYGNSNYTTCCNLISLRPQCANLIHQEMLSKQLVIKQGSCRKTKQEILVGSIQNWAG